MAWRSRTRCASTEGMWAGLDRSTSGQCCYTCYVMLVMHCAGSVLCRPLSQTQRSGGRDSSEIRARFERDSSEIRACRSYGGYACLAGLTFTPEMYACGVDIVGPSNIKTLLDSIPPYWVRERTHLCQPVPHCALRFHTVLAAPHYASRFAPSATVPSFLPYLRTHFPGPTAQRHAA